MSINPARAAHALHVLIADGKIAARDVTDALKRREQLIHELRQRLTALEHGVISSIKASGKKVRKAKRRMTASRRAALKLHGKYLGHVRKLSKADRAKIKAIRETKGVRAGIAAARRIGK